MRVLLVTSTDQLPGIFSILNPKLEYCAIVVDEVEPTKKILEQVGLPKDLLHPLYELKECVKDFYYDYLLCITDGRTYEPLTANVYKYTLTRDKFVCLHTINSPDNFLLERALRYYKMHATEFEMFATGMSFIEQGIDSRRFKKRIFNFGVSTQDLYYDYKVAKYAVLCGGYNRLKYALIGLAPYSFNYDQSKLYAENCTLLRYAIAFKDLHNFFMPVEDYCKLFREEYLTFKLPLIDQFDVSGVHANNALHFMNFKSRISAREIIDKWDSRNFPRTRAENIKIFDDYLTLCEENHIRPIIFLPPLSEGYIKYFSRQKLDEFYYLIGQACKKHPSAIFIDGWKLQGLTDADFYDYGHLNFQGATKISLFLNDFIERLQSS